MNCPTPPNLADEILKTWRTIGLSRGEVRRFLTATYGVPVDTLDAVMVLLADAGFFSDRRQRAPGQQISVRERMLQEAERCLRSGHKVPGMRELTRRVGSKSSAAPYSHFTSRTAFLEALSKRTTFTWRDIEL